MKKIHVNQHNIRANLKGSSKPVITVKEGRSNRYADGVEIHGPSRIVYSGGNAKPLLSCGARVIIETDAEITLIGERHWTENS